MINFPCDYSELEIVGFDGKTRAVCGRFLPLVRHKETDQFFKLSLRDPNAKSRAVFSRDEIEIFATEDRLTFLSEPVPAFEDALVVYLKSAILDASELPLPEPYIWQELSDDTWATCIPKVEAEQLLNDFGQTLMNKATDLLSDFFVRRDQDFRAAAKRMTDMAICATTDQELRSRIYLRYGLSVMFSNTPERLDNVYQLIIRREFPTWTWETFQMRLLRFKDMVYARAFPNVTFEKSSRYDSPMLSMIVEQISRIKTFENFKERHDECEKVAAEFRAQYPPELETLRRVGQQLCENDGIRLEDEALSILAGDAVFYHYYFDRPFEIKKDKPRPRLTIFDYYDTLKKAGLQDSEVAKCIFEQCQPIAEFRRRGTAPD
ncbi:MAG TPA: hypothetical protein VF658_09545 [Pyrinomonadaceae bacterium]|jgi:hypothetical protein